MRSVLLSVAALIGSFGLLLAGNSLQFIALGQRAAIEGFPTLAMGLINTAYFAGYAVGSLYASRMVDTVGHIRTFAALASAVSGIVLCHVVLADPLAWGIMRFVTGLCFAGLYTVVESWLNARATNEVRGRVLSVYGATAFLGFSIGPLLANLGPEDGQFVFIATSILISFALVPVTVTRASAPVSGARQGEDFGSGTYSLWRLYRETPLGMVGIVLVGMVQGAFLSSAPLFAEARDFSTALLSAFVSLTLVSGMLAQYPLGWLSDRLDRRLTILWIAAAGAVAALFAALAGQAGALLLFASSMVMGAAIFPLYAVLVAYTNDWIPENALVQAAGAIQLSYGIGSMVGPSAAAITMDAVGPFGMFACIGATMALLSAFTIFRMWRRGPVDASAQTDFVAVAPTTGSLGFDPRIEDDQLSFDFAPTADAE